MAGAFAAQAAKTGGEGKGLRSEEVDVGRVARVPPSRKLCHRRIALGSDHDASVRRQTPAEGKDLLA
jgi:hypothetical protein